MNRHERRARAAREFHSQRPEHRLGDAPVEAAYHDKMVAIMQTLDEFMNGSAKGPARKTGIVVMVFPLNDGPGRCNYMSNGVDRGDIVTLMKEMIARFEGQPEMEGRA
jgi:alpha-D-ribose 1-methylphosphonate 5-triphosphate synthase subunit PhnH